MDQRNPPIYGWDYKSCGFPTVHEYGLRDVSPDIGRRDFGGPDLLHIHVSKALGEARCVDSDPQHKAIYLTSSIKNIAIKINSGLQGIQVRRLAIYKRGIY